MFYYTLLDMNTYGQSKHGAKQKWVKVDMTPWYTTTQSLKC